MIRKESIALRSTYHRVITEEPFKLLQCVEEIRNLTSCQKQKKQKKQKKRESKRKARDFSDRLKITVRDFPKSVGQSKRIGDSDADLS